MKIAVEGEPGEAERKLEELSERVRAKISNYLFAEGDASMEEVVAQLLSHQNIKLAVAESCTGGLIGHRITNVPGSSKFLLADLVTYSNEVKQDLLGVTDATLNDAWRGERGMRARDGGGSSQARRRRCRHRNLGHRGSRWRHARQAGRHRMHRAGFRRSEDLAALPDARYARLGEAAQSSQVALDWLRRYALKIPIEESQLFRR